MQNFRILAATLVAIGCMHVPSSFADPKSTQDDSSVDTAQSQGFADNSVEDLIAIAQVGQENETVNEAVLGNNAITDALPDIGVANGRSAANSANTNSANTNNDNSAITPSQPRQSSAQGVNSDKLILNSPVVDHAGILSAQEKQILEQRLRSIYDRGLAQAALIIVPTTNRMDIFQYSMEVAERWELGEADTDDGLLILVAVNDRDMYILTGYGLEGVLPDALNKRIIDTQITPYFKQGDYAGGLLNGIAHIEERLTADSEILARADAQAQARQNTQNGSAPDNPSPIVLFIIAMVFGGFINSIFGRFLGSTLTAGGFLFLAVSFGNSLFLALPMSFFLWLFLLTRGGGGRGGRGGGGVIFFPGGGFGGGSSGGFGGGGFGGGGFGGGGGGFGGGGAGGSW